MAAGPAAASAEGEGVAGDPAVEVEPQAMVSGLRQIDQAVEALLADLDPAGVDVGAGATGIDRLAVQLYLDPTRPLAAGEHQEHAPGTKACVQTSTSDGGRMIG